MVVLPEQGGFGDRYRAAVDGGWRDHLSCLSLLMGDAGLATCWWSGAAGVKPVARRPPHRQGRVLGLGARHRPRTQSGRDRLSDDKLSWFDDGWQTP